MTEIIDEIFKIVPKEKITDAVFEGANIVLYSKDKHFLFNSGDLIRSAVMDVKKRIQALKSPAKDNGKEPKPVHSRG